eukprot:2490551-Prymnesium_polylepis.1
MARYAPSARAYGWGSIAVGDGASRSAPISGCGNRFIGLTAISRCATYVYCSGGRGEVHFGSVTPTAAAEDAPVPKHDCARASRVTPLPLIRQVLPPNQAGAAHNQAGRCYRLVAREPAAQVVEDARLVQVPQAGHVSLVARVDDRHLARARVHLHALPMAAAGARSTLTAALARIRGAHARARMHKRARAALLPRSNHSRGAAVRRGPGARGGLESRTLCVRRRRFELAKPSALRRPPCERSAPAVEPATVARRSPPSRRPTRARRRPPPTPPSRCRRAGGAAAARRVRAPPLGLPPSLRPTCAGSR